MTQNVRDLIAEARELLGGTIRADHESEEARGVISHLVDALEASLVERDAAVVAIKRVQTLADFWNDTPDYQPSEYDKGRVDQRHAMAEQLIVALDKGANQE